MTEPAAPAEGSAWQRISPLALIDFLVVMVRQGLFQALPGLIVLFASAASSDNVELVWVVWATGALVLFALVWSVLSFLRFGFRVGHRRIDVRKGVLHRQVLNVDFDRIQNVSVQEPFYLRPFGLAVVGIDTAGSSGKEIRLPGIALKEARALRGLLVAEATDTAAPADAESAHETESVETSDPAGEVLLRLTRRDVVIAGLTANFMLWAAVAIGTVFGSGDTAEQLIGGLAQRFELQEAADALRREGGDLLLGLAVAGAVLGVMILLPLVSVVGALFRYDGYTLSVDGDRFRRASGLLSRHDDSVRQHKIQAVTWKQNAIALLFGRINLQLRQASAGTGAEAGQPGAGLKPSFQVPSLKPEEAHTLTDRFLGDSDSGAIAWTGVDRRSWMRMNVLLLLMPFTVGMVCLAALVHVAFLGPWFVVSLLWGLIAYRTWKQTGWAVVGNHAMFRKGFIGSNTTVFPLFKVQRVDLVQTPLQRRKGLAHLTVHLASHSMTVPWMRYADAERLRDLALYEAERSRNPWF